MWVFVVILKLGALDVGLDLVLVLLFGVYSFGSSLYLRCLLCLLLLTYLSY